MTAAQSPASRASSGADEHERGSRVSARWRIVGWIVLTTSIALLAVIVTMRSLLLGQVDQGANEGIVQEVDEFRTFAAEGVDPQTAQPFASETALMQRYLSRQTPATHEAFVAVSGEEVLFLDNAADDAGERLAGDPHMLESLLEDPEVAGETVSEYGTVRWGRVDTEAGSSFLVLQFTDPARGEVDQNVLLLVAVAGGGVLLTALIAWFAAGQILQPVRRIGEVAESVTGHRLSQRIPIEGRDDIARAAQSVNDMLDRLEAASDRQRHVAVEASRHLARPLAGLRRDLDEGSTPTAERLRPALRSMQRTLEDLELVGAHGSGRLRFEPTPAAQLLVQVRQDAARRAPQRHWVLEEVPSVTAPMDAQAVRSALLQLARNAVDHTADGQEIRIIGEVLDPSTASAEEAEAAQAVSALEGPVLRLGVSNPGRPLSPDQVRAMVEDYRSAASALDARDSEAPEPSETSAQDAAEEPSLGEGMGLGLAVVRGVADAHGGSLWVESDPQGRTTVGLDLPLADGADDDLQDRVVRAMGEQR